MDARTREADNRPVVELDPAQCRDAASIQAVIDRLGPDGGAIRLPESEITVDRGIELAAHVKLVGSGEGTILRKAPDRVYPLSGCHNYGMADVPLEHTEGLEVGMAAGRTTVL